MSLIDRKQVFISYSHKDGEAFANYISEFLSQIDAALWQDIHRMIGDHDIWTEVKNAIDESEHLVIVLTKNALQSGWVRREWFYALENGINVCPVIFDKNCVGELSGWQKSRKYYDFESLSDKYRLLDVVKGSGVRDKLSRYIPEMPVKYIKRDIVTKIRDRLIDKDGNAIKTTIALIGPGGYGKTVVANAVCMDEDIRVVYSGGIIPVVIGNDISFSSRNIYESRLIGKIEDVIYSIKKHRPAFSSLDAALNELAVILASIDNALLFVDDIWRESDLRLFLRVSRYSSIIITTRNRSYLYGNVEKYDIGALSTEDSYGLLSFDLPGEIGYDEKSELKILSDKLYGWPQLIGMANRTIMRKCEKGCCIKDSVLAFSRLLDRNGYLYFDPQYETDRDRSLAACIEASIDTLSEKEKQRFFELSIFPEDESIPFDIIFLLWEKTGNMNDDESRNLCEYFYDCSLLVFFSDKNKIIKIHDNILSYLKNKCSLKKRSEINGILVDAIKVKYSAGLSEIPVNNKYIWDNIVWHLGGCERFEEMTEMLANYKWIKNKLAATNCFALYADYFIFDMTELIGKIGQAIGLSLEAIGENIDLLPSQLFGRLGYCQNNAGLLNNLLYDLESECKKRSFYFLFPSLTPPGIQKMKLPGYKRDEPVVSVSYCYGDVYIVGSTDCDHKIIWRSDTGEVFDDYNLREPEDQSVYYSDDFIFSAVLKEDGVLRIMSIYDKEIVLEIPFKHSVIQNCVFSGNKKQVLLIVDYCNVLIYSIFGLQLGEFTASDNIVDAVYSNNGYGFIILLKSGALLYFKSSNFNNYKQFGPFENKVYKCLFLPDDEKVLGVFDDNRLFVWDLKLENKYVLLESAGLAFISGLAVSCKLSVIIASDIKGRICVWSLSDYSLIKSYEDHRYSVNKIKVSTSGDMLLSASYDNTANIYDLINNDLLQVFKGHEGSVNDISFSSDQKFVITGSSDSTVRQWYVKKGDIPQMYKNFHEQQVNHVCLSCESDILISSSDDKLVKLWDVRTGKLFGEPYETGYSVIKSIISKSGKIAASLSVGGNVDVFNVCEKPKKIFNKSFFYGNKKISISALQFSPDSNIIAVAGTDYIIRLIGVFNDHIMILKEGHEALINSLEFSSDGKKLLSASNDHMCLVWDVDADINEPILLQGHHDRINTAMFSRDGKYILTASSDGTAKIWFAVNGKMIIEFDCALGFKKVNDVNVKRAVYSLSNDCVFTWSVSYISENECYWSARVWSIGDQSVIAALDDCFGNPSEVIFSSDGRYIIYAIGQYIKIYDLLNNIEHDCLVVDNDVTTLSYNDDYICAGDKLGVVHMCRFQR